MCGYKQLLDMCLTLMAVLGRAGSTTKYCEYYKIS